MSSRFVALTFAAVALLMSTSSHAAPEPIVFDFGGGLQGWELGGTAQRVRTQVLGGEWAIFGDGILEPGGFGRVDGVTLRSYGALNRETF